MLGFNKVLLTAGEAGGPPVVAPDSNYADYIDSLSPLAYWKMDDVTGPLFDKTLNGYDGVVSGSPNFEQPSMIDGDEGTSIEFPLGSYATAPDIADIQSLVFSGIIQDDQETIALSAYSSDVNNWVVYSGNGSSGKARLVSDGTSIESDLVVDDGVKHHFVVTFDGADTIWYIDGIKQSTTVTGNMFINYTGGALIAHRMFGSTVQPHGTGSLDDLAVFGQPITEIQAQDLYNLSIGATVASPYSYYIQSLRPVGYWRLGEKIGSLCLDSSGNSYNGSYIGGTTLGEPGLLVSDTDTAVAFDGSTGYVEMPHYDDLSIITDLSIVASVKMDAIGDRSRVINCLGSGETEGNNVCYSLEITGGGDCRYFHEYGGGSNVTDRDFNTNFQAGETYHIVLTRRVDVTENDVFVDLYIDGEFFSSASTITNIPTGGWNSAVRIANEMTNVYMLDGIIDEVAVYNKILSTDEIRNIYALSQGDFNSYPAYTFKTDPYSYWRLGDAGTSIEETYFAYVTNTIAPQAYYRFGEANTTVPVNQGFLTNATEPANWHRFNLNKSIIGNANATSADFVTTGEKKYCEFVVHTTATLGVSLNDNDTPTSGSAGNGIQLLFTGGTGLDIIVNGVNSNTLTLANSVGVDSVIGIGVTYSGLLIDIYVDGLFEFTINPITSYSLTQYTTPGYIIAYTGQNSNSATIRTISSEFTISAIPSGFTELSTGTGYVMVDQINASENNGQYYSGTILETPGLVDGDIDTCINVDTPVIKMPYTHDATNNQFSFSTIIDYDSAEGDAYIVSYDAPNAIDKTFEFAIASGIFEVTIGNGLASETIQLEPVPVGVHRSHLAITIDGYDVKFYLNGYEAASATSTVLLTSPQPTYDFSIGDSGLVAKVDEMIFTTDILTPEEVANLGLIMQDKMLPTTTATAHDDMNNADGTLIRAYMGETSLVADVPNASVKLEPVVGSFEALSAMQVGTGVFSISFLIQPSDLTDDEANGIISESLAEFQFYSTPKVVDTTQCEVYCGTDTLTRFEPSDLNNRLVLTEGTISHIVFTHDNGTSNLYLNGELIGTKAQSTPTQITNLKAFGPDCKFDEITLYNKVLSQAEISGLVSLIDQATDRDYYGRFWRINITGTGLNEYAMIGEVTMSTASGGPNIIVPNSVGAIATSQDATDTVPLKAITGNGSADDWQSANFVPPNTEWWAYDFGEGNSQSIAEFTIQATDRSDQANRSPSDFTIEYSDNAINWHNFGTYTGQTWTISETKTFATDLPPIGNYQTYAQALNPVGYWRLGETTGTNCIDYSGNGYDGTYVGEPGLGADSLLTNDTSGNKAVSFDGNNDVVQMSQYPALAIQGDLTVVFNINMTTSTSTGCVITCGNNTSSSSIYNTSYMLEVNSSGDVSYLHQFNNGSNTTLRTYQTNMVDGQTYHIVFTRDDAPGNGVTRCYVNGTQASSYTYGSNPTGGTEGFIRIGSNSEEGEYIEAVIDELMVFDRVLTTQEIDDLVSLSMTGNV